MSELTDKIKDVLKDVELVLAWRRSPVSGTAEPAFIRTLEEADEAIFDSTCVNNLAVYLPRLKGRKVGIVAKGCDTRSIVQLIIEREVERGMLTVIGVPCPGMVDVRKVWRCFGFGRKLEDSGGQVAMEGKTAPREEILLHKCRGCRDAQPVIADVTVGDIAAVQVAPASEPAGLRERFAAMSPDERDGFWNEQFARCIRCNACREACPMCFCRDRCTIQRREPHWVGGQIDSAQARFAQMIRLGHLAGRCTGCEECERACPVGIPLMLLFEEQNRAVEKMFDYRAGTQLDARPPLLAFDIDSDMWGKG